MALELHLRLDSPEFADVHFSREPNALSREIALAIPVASQGVADDPITIEGRIAEALWPVEGQPPPLDVGGREYRQLAQQASTNWEQVAEKAQREREAMDAVDMGTRRWIGPDDQMYPLLLARVELPTGER